jgi:hypothetical protein
MNKAKKREPPHLLILLGAFAILWCSLYFVVGVSWFLGISEGKTLNLIRDITIYLLSFAWAIFLATHIFKKRFGIATVGLLLLLFFWAWVFDLIMV